MRLSEPTNAQARQIASRNTQFPAGLAPSDESGFPANPFGSGSNRFSPGIAALGPNPPRSQGGTNSIRNITHSLLIVSFPDNSETRLVPGDMAMVARTVSKHDSRHAVAEVSYVNHQARQEFNRGLQALLGDESAVRNTLKYRDENVRNALASQHVPGAMPGRAPMFDMLELVSTRKDAAIYGQDQYVPRTRVLENYEEYESRGLDNLPTESEVLDAYYRNNGMPAREQEELDALKKREAAQRRVDDTFREYMPVHGKYLTLDGLMNVWNMYAPVIRPSWSKRENDNRAKMGTPSITFGMTRRVFVRNRWGGNIRQGAIIGYILKRAQINEARQSTASSDGYGEFSWIPYYSNARRLPSAQDLQFRTIDGSLEYGHFFFLGTANNLASGRISEATCREAMALDGYSYAHAREKTGLLDKIEILVRHRIM